MNYVILEKSVYVLVIFKINKISRAGESESGVFGSWEPEPLEEKKPGAGAAWKKSQEPEPQKICRLLSPARRKKALGNCTLVTLL